MNPEHIYVFLICSIWFVFELCIFKGKSRNRSYKKRWRIILQPVESGGNFSVNVEHLLKSPRGQWITFIFWCYIFSSLKVSAALRHQRWKTTSVHTHIQHFCVWPSVYLGNVSLKSVPVVSSVSVLCEALQHKISRHQDHQGLQHVKCEERWGSSRRKLRDTFLYLPK